MTPERWERVGAIFGEAMELAEAERDAYLERACAGDARLRAEVLELLARNDRPGAFLDSPPLAGAELAQLTAGEWSSSCAFQPGDLIGGRFRLERFVGEGVAAGTIMAADLSQRMGWISIQG